MRIFSSFAGISVLALALTSAPGSLPGQDQTKTPQAAPKALPGNDETNCTNARVFTEQFDELQRNLDLARLAQLAQEVEMRSPELEKLRSLSAELRNNRELEADAEELAAQAEALASGAQEKAPVFERHPSVLIESDDESGWLGVEIGEVTAEKAKDLRLSATRGVIVSAIEPDSPAAKAGLKENDIITQYDGQVVEGTVQFRRLVRETPPGRTVELGISRGGASQTISVELGDRSAFFEKKMEGKMRDFGNVYAFRAPNFDFKTSPEWFAPLADLRTPTLGLSAEDLNGQLGEYFGAPDNAGVLVREVHEGTPAAKAGLKAGDVIVKVDGKPIRSLADLREQLRDKSGDKPVNLGVLRRGSEMSLSVTIERPKPLEPLHLQHRAQL